MLDFLLKAKTPELARKSFNYAANEIKTSLSNFNDDVVSDSDMMQRFTSTLKPQTGAVEVELKTFGVFAQNYIFETTLGHQ